VAAVNLRPNERLIVGSTTEDAVKRAADHVVQLLAGTEGTRSVALAGGKTPAALYAALTGPPWRDRVDWRRIEWFWGDERCVPPDHADSNYRMSRETLLDPLSIPEDRIHRMPADATDLNRAASDYEQTIRACVPPNEAAVPANDIGVPAFDLILLGIGVDGHTASLFPGSAGLRETRRLVVAHHVPSLNTWRMTMTFPLLQAAHEIVFLVTGADKARAIERIFRAPSASEGSLLVADLPPAARVRGNARHVTWILDTTADRLVDPHDPA